MRSAATASLITLAFFFGNLDRALAQSWDQQQPIVLTVSPSCCQSPATMAGHVPQRTGMLSPDVAPSMSDGIPFVPTASTLVPLPATRTFRRYGADMTTVIEYPADVVAVPAGPSVEVLRPASAPTVPAGYVIGRGLIGQPKLYVPGQSVRNFLRYISL